MFVISIDLLSCQGRIGDQLVNDTHHSMSQKDERKIYPLWPPIPASTIIRLDSPSSISENHVSPAELMFLTPLPLHKHLYKCKKTFLYDMVQLGNPQHH
jgi:hypothetical protein